MERMNMPKSGGVGSKVNEEGELGKRRVLCNRLRKRKTSKPMRT